LIIVVSGTAGKQSAPRKVAELIEKIRLGAWNPEGDPQDRQQIAAMAAKGCQEAFRRVKQSVARVLQGEKAGLVLRQDYPTSSHLFTGERKGPLTDSTVRKMVARAGTASGLEFPVHPHMLRHAAGYKLANANRRELRSKSNGLLAYSDKNTDRTFGAKNRNAEAGDQTGKFIPRE
jgi:hypothetical protein